MERHARAKGLDPESITEGERESLREEMISENYPGNFKLGYILYEKAGLGHPPINPDIFRLDHLTKYPERNHATKH